MASRMPRQGKLQTDADYAEQVANWLNDQANPPDPLDKWKLARALSDASDKANQAFLDSLGPQVLPPNQVTATTNPTQQLTQLFQTLYNQYQGVTPEFEQAARAIMSTAEQQRNAYPDRWGNMIDPQNPDSILGSDPYSGAAARRGDPRDTRDWSGDALGDIAGGAAGAGESGSGFDQAGGSGSTQGQRLVFGGGQVGGTYTGSTGYIPPDTGSGFTAGDIPGIAEAASLGTLPLVAHLLSLFSGKSQAPPDLISYAMPETQAFRGALDASDHIAGADTSQTGQARTFGDTRDAEASLTPTAAELTTPSGDTPDQWFQDNAFRIAQAVAGALRNNSSLTDAITDI